MKDKTSCRSCGAALTVSATHCDLCGTSVEGVADSNPTQEPSESVRKNTEPESRVVNEVVNEVVNQNTSTDPVHCSTCFHVNPARSKFCNQCGSFLGESPIRSDSPAPAAILAPSKDEVEETDLSASDANTQQRPPSTEGKQALKLVGYGLLAVLALYAITRLSSNGDATGNDGPGVDATGEAVGAVIPDSVQALISRLESENTAASWGELGTVYLSLAFTAANEEERTAQAQQAVDAFEISLGMQENLDVRTGLAEASQFDPRNPMRPVQELQTVLQQDPDHITANYLMGSLRARINRLEAAAESFRRVIELTNSTDPIAIQANQDLAEVERRLAEGG